MFHIFLFSFLALRRFYEGIHDEKRFVKAAGGQMEDFQITDVGERHKSL
jgi:hypothetical protein